VFDGNPFGVPLRLALGCSRDEFNAAARSYHPDDPLRSSATSAHAKESFR